MAPKSLERLEHRKSGRSQHIEKMRYGQIVAKISQEECMDLMQEIPCDKELHAKAARVYKKVGQSIDLHGKEDKLIVSESAAFWNEQHCETAVAASQPAPALVASVAADNSNRYDFTNTGGESVLMISL